MKKSLALCALLSLSLNAGKVSVTGSATEYRDAEFATISMTVKSVCFETPAAARSANDETVAALQKQLSPMLNTENGIDALFTKGGYSSTYSESYYEDNRKITRCENTFQKSTTIQFKTANLAKISNIFDELQAMVLSDFSQSSEGTATTFASISEPSVDVCEHTREEMRDCALTGAQCNARHRFDIFAKAAGLCGEAKLCEADLDPKYESNSNRFSYAESAPKSGSSIVNLNFRPLSETCTVTNVYEVENNYFEIGADCNEQ